MARLTIASRPETVTLMNASIRFGGLLREPAPDVQPTTPSRQGQTCGELRPATDQTLVGTPFDAGYFTALLRSAGTDPTPFDLATHRDDTLDLVPRGLLLP